MSKRTLIFEEYVLRRAYGVYYAVWATGFLAYVSVPYFILRLPNELIWVAYLLGYGVTSLLLMTITSRVFFTAQRTLRLRRSLDRRGVWGRFGKRSLTGFLLFFGLFFGIATASVYLLGGRGISIYFAALVVFGGYLARQIKASFGRLSAEGLVAVISYGAASVASAVAAAYGVWGYVAAAWVVAAACWLFSSLYALYRAPEEYASRLLQVDRD